MGVERLEGTGAIKPTRRAGVGLKALMFVVACCGVVFWASRAIREGMIPAYGWARALRTGDADARQVAASQLGLVEDAGQAGLAIPALVAALDDEDDEVTFAAVHSLGEVGVVAIKARAELPEIRASASALARALGHKAVNVRIAAACALDGLARASFAAGDRSLDLEMLTAALAGVLGDPSEQVRIVAVKALIGVAENPSVAPPSALLAMLSGGKSVALREMAATALGGFHSGTGAAMPALMAALDDPEPYVRVAAASALGKFGPTARPALPALIALMDEPYVPPTGRPAPRILTPPETDPAAEAALAIGSIVSVGAPDLESVQALAQILFAGHPSRRSAAAQALFSIGKGAFPAIPTLMTTLVEGARVSSGHESWAARALGRAAPGSELASEAVEALTQGLDAKFYGTRGYSAEALGLFGPAASRALPRLRESAKEKDDFVARMARAAIEKIEKK